MHSTAAKRDPGFRRDDELVDATLNGAPTAREMPTDSADPEPHPDTQRSNPQPARSSWR